MVVGQEVGLVLYSKQKTAKQILLGAQVVVGQEEGARVVVGQEVGLVLYSKQKTAKPRVESTTTNILAFMR